MSFDDLLDPAEISELREKKDFINIFALAFMWVQVVFAFVLFIFFPNPFTFFISMLVIAAKQFQMVVFMHDGAHGLIFKNRKLNDLVSQWLCAFPVMSDTLPYRKVHSQHHKYTDTDKDPDLGLTDAFPTSWQSLARKFLRDLTGVAGIRRYSAVLISAWGKEDTFFKSLKRILSKLKGFLLTNSLIFVVLLSFGQGWLYLLLWWLPMLTFFSLFYRIRSITEHSGLKGDDDFSFTRTTLVPWYLRYFLAPLNVNYHIEHHLFTFCPWYNLPKAHRMLVEKGFIKEMEISQGYLPVLKRILIQ
ncbi:fatty acid desaturase family protein [Gammaproteobacteria bacterium]|nr:fatty acid desaturase family protein [Gammaproteobacteria bacterium]